MPPRSTLGKAIDLARRGYNKPPHVIALWLWRKFSERRAANRLPKLAARMTPELAARRLGHSSPEAALKAALQNPPFPVFRHAKADTLTGLNDTSRGEILARAKAALERRVRFLGSDEVTLGHPIDWATDFKSGISWPMTPSSGLEVLDLDRHSDIKVPWELSRLQWLLPAGQAYMLTGDEAYAEFAKDIISEWIEANPVCIGPNWICAMDVAMRAMSIAWLFYACDGSRSWADEDFRAAVLVQLSLHAEFVLEHLEWSDIAGNHLTTDLAGLVIIGLMLGGKGRAKIWIEKGWHLLEEQFPMQVPDDGVCREASVPYHRLVAELFLLPALARRAHGLHVDELYWQRLKKMADFIDAYTRPDGSVPLWGDADDGRALPLGTQDLNDHRYLIETLRHLDQAPRHPKWDETLWWLGPDDGITREEKPAASSAFENAGVYILRGQDTNVFIDAGPVGMAGRGGHGHNDCLSFEVFMEGQPLIVDPGCYVYTPDWQARNRFRGTSAHNTPIVDGEEINRIPRDDWLWYLENDAVPEIRHWSTSDDVDILVAAHSGYQRLPSPVTPVRGFMLERSTRRLFVADGFEGSGEHDVRIPYTFAPGCEVECDAAGIWKLTRNGKKFGFVVSAPETWTASPVAAEYSASYGVKQSVQGLVLNCSGTLRPVAVAIMPESALPPDPVRWLRNLVAGRFPVPGFKT